MAFLKVIPESTTDRFSMLLLEPGEMFLLDLAVLCYPFGVQESEALGRCQEGRLKVCTKCIVFDPKDTKLPIQKFLYVDIKEIEQWKAPLITGLGTESTNFHISADRVIEMKADNIVAPYVFKRVKCRVMFRLIHARVDECLRYMHQLHRASELHGHDKSYMLSAFTSSLLTRKRSDLKGRLESIYENIVAETQCIRVTPLITHPGHIMLTDKLLYFLPFNDYGPALMLKIRLSDIKRVIKRRFLLRHEAIEIYCRTDYRTRVSHVYLSLTNESERDQFYNLLLNQPGLVLDDASQENMTYRWQNGAVSNYDYLLYLNSLADRSINDLTQYPVFPWVLSNYTSPTLDLSDEANYRDLSKPIGALDQERLQKLLDRYEDMPEPKYLYGTHYSTPGHVLFYLTRAAPEWVLCLHNGRFDHPDRMFNSVADTYRNVLSGVSDFKELTPEFYSGDGKFLQNKYYISFGNRQNGRPVTDVELPPWASDVQDFINKMREALESDYVSRNLHHWIDLIFGYKQTGEEAIKANNVFYHLTYEGAVDVVNVTDRSERSSLETQIAEFGQIPTQIFSQPHPQRIVRKTSSSYNRLSTSDQPSEPPSRPPSFLGQTSCEGHPSCAGHPSCTGQPSCEGQPSLGELPSPGENKTSCSEVQHNEGEGSSNINSDLMSSSKEPVISENEQLSVASPSAAEPLETGDILNTSTDQTDSGVLTNKRSDNKSLFNERSDNKSSTNESSDSQSSTNQRPDNKSSTNERPESNGGSFDLCNIQRYSSYNLHKATVSDVRWGSEMEDFIYSTSKDGTLKIFSQKKQAQFQSITISRQPFSSFAMLPTEKRAAIGGWDNYIYLYNIDCARCLDSVYAHDDAVSQISLNDHFLLSGSWDSTVKLWICSNREGNDVKLKLQETWDHDSGVYCVSQNIDSTRVVSGTKEGELKIWDPQYRHPLYTSIIHKDAVRSVTFSEDYTHILSCGDDGYVHMFDSRTATHVFSYSTDKKLRCAAWNDRQVLIGCSDGDLLVWDMINGKIITTLPSLHKAPMDVCTFSAITCMDFSKSNERKLLIGGSDNIVSMWSA